MATTVYLRKSTPGGSIYDTFAAAKAASSSGSGPSDRSEIVCLDSETYAEAMAFGALQWIDFICAPGCSPAFAYTTGVITAGAGANGIRVIGDPDGPGLLQLAGGGSGSDLINMPAGCSFEISDFEYEAVSGIGCNVIEGPGTTGDEWTFTRFDCLGGSWASPVKGANISTVTIDQCNWLAMTSQTGPIVTTNKGTVHIWHSRLIGSTWIGSMSSLGSPSARHTLNRSILVYEYNVLFPAMIDLRASVGHSIGADIFKVELIGDSSVGSIGLRTEYGTEDVRNLIVTGFLKTWHSTVAWSPTYSSSYGYSGGTPYGGLATAGAGMITADPDLDVDYRPNVGSPCVDTGTATGLPDDIDGASNPSGLAEDMGAYEYPEPAPHLLSAAMTGKRQIAVLFDTAMDITTMGVADWTLTATCIAGAVPGITATSLSGDGLTCYLDLDADLEPFGLYTVEVAVTAESAGGTVIDPDHRTASLRVPWAKGGIELSTYYGGNSAAIRVRLVEVWGPNPRTVEV